MRRYSCSDRMCGAEDCALCHPELQRTAECACCGSEHALYEDWYGDDGNLCANCADKVQCDGCGEWVDAHELDHGPCPEYGFCPECVKIAVAG